MSPTIRPRTPPPWQVAAPLVGCAVVDGVLLATAAGPGAVRLAGSAGLALVVLAAAAVTSRERQHARVAASLQVLASTDVLTGLANRRLFLERLDAHLAAPGAARSAVVLVDIDLFKRVNDAHGHDVGDEVLVAVARELAAGCRSDDTAARLGGEEFALLLPGAGLDDALRIAESVRSRVRTMARIPVTISCGVTSVAGSDASARDVLVRADAALYDAKRRGRDRVVAAPTAGPDGRCRRSS